MTLTVGSLFSGIGGLDLGLERAGMEVIWQSEIDPYACRVLNKHWPKVVNHGNIKEIDWTRVERPDVICGGYPCQPFSTAGQRKGEDDPRHLWPWVRECISVLRPRYAILENVQGHLSLGGTTVLREITELGYDAEWRVVSAASVGANHRRNRLIIVAYPRSKRLETERTQLETSGTIGSSENSGQFMAYPNHGGHVYAQEPQEPYIRGRSENEASDERGTTNNSRVYSGTGNLSNVADSDDNGSSAAPFHGSNSTTTNDTQTRQNHTANIERRGGLSELVADPAGEGLQRSVREIYEGAGERFTYGGWQWWQTEPDVGRVANGVPARVDRLRGLGNAVVPQVAEVIGRLVMAHASENQ